MKLSILTQRSEELAEVFISHFTRLRNKCKIHLPNIEYIKMDQRGQDIELRKTFQDIEFRDFYQLLAKVV